MHAAGCLYLLEMIAPVHVFVDTQVRSNAIQVENSRTGIWPQAT